MISYHLSVILELVEQVIDLGTLDLDDEGVWHLGVLSRNDQVIGLREEHLDIVDAIAEVSLAHINSFFLDNGVLVTSLLRGITFSLLVEAATSGTGRLLLLSYDEVWLGKWVLVSAALVGVLTNVLEQPFPRIFLLLPLRHIIIS